MLTWVEFIACAVAITLAGSRLSRYGDVIAEKTGLSGTWIGLALLATVTSLPELMTGVSAVTIANEPNIALGDVLGSCVFNLLILVILDYLYRGESLYTKASQGHILSAGFGVVLIGFVGFSLLLSQKEPGLFPNLGHVGGYSIIIVLLYLLAMRTVFGYEKRQLAEFTAERAERYPDITLRQASLRYAAAALVVVVAGILLPFIGKALAQMHGWHTSFVGALFIAAATSLPELVVTLSALRLKALDMAIANLLGSNLFNIVIIAIDDAFFTRGPILSHVSVAHAVSALSAMIMSGAVIIGLVYRPKSKLFGAVGWTSLFLFVFYAFNAYVLYLHGE
jgi:cation:H+ antiporter